jgi:hypothetical protein
MFTLGEIDDICMYNLFGLCSGLPKTKAQFLKLRFSKKAKQAHLITGYVVYLASSQGDQIGRIFA